MKKLLALTVLVASLFATTALVGCAAGEPEADTSGVVHQDDAPPVEGDTSGGSPKSTDATENSSEGGN